MKRNHIAVLVVLMFVGCRRADVREVTVEMPELTDSQKPLVVQALSNYAGIKKDTYRWDMEKKTLTLKYDSMSIAQANIRMAISDKGIKVIFPVKATGKAGY